MWGTGDATTEESMVKALCVLVTSSHMTNQPPTEPHWHLLGAYFVTHALPG
jgi:hypothetical protein